MTELQTFSRIRGNRDRETRCWRQI